MKFVDLVTARNPLQRKALRLYLSKKDDLYWEAAELFSSGLSEIIAKKSIDIDFVVDAYIKMCKDMLSQQILFKKTGKYSCEHSKEAYDNVYSSEKTMASYMYGLALSQFLWPNHYEIFRYFQNICKGVHGVKRYLEIGPGHGMYLIEAMRIFSKAEFCAVDVSPVSLKISTELIAHFNHDTRCHFVTADIKDFKDSTFDFISMCEVLEHLDETKPILNKLHRMTAPGGHVFITTCANCPAIDHIYLYDSVGHIREELTSAGFAIIKDLPLAVGDVPDQEWETQRTEINYAALLMRRDDI